MYAQLKKLKYLINDKYFLLIIKAHVDSEIFKILCFCLSLSRLLKIYHNSLYKKKLENVINSEQENINFIN